MPTIDANIVSYIIIYIYLIYEMPNKSFNLVNIHLNVILLLPVPPQLNQEPERLLPDTAKICTGTMINIILYTCLPAQTKMMKFYLEFRAQVFEHLLAHSNSVE